MSRIANYASQQILNTYLQKVQQRLNTTQIQLTSEKKAQDYMGIGYDTQRLVTYEVDINTLNGYQRNNDIEDIYLKSTDAALNGAQTTINDFSKTLDSFNALNITDEASIRTLQEQAFRSMKTLQSYLNTEVNGRQLFGGNRVNTPPVELGLTTLEDFQAKYDGVNVRYPTTRVMHTENFNLSADSANKSNWLTFTQDADGNVATAGTSTITATTAQFANVTVGSTIEITGTANNNGTYEVGAVSGGGTTIEVITKMLTDEAAVTGAILTRVDGTTLSAANFTDLTFNRAAGTVVAATAASLSSLPAGSSFTVTGTTQNNGTYLIESNDGTTVTIKETKLVDEGTAATPTLSLAAQSFTFTDNVTSFDTISTAVAGTFSALKSGMSITFGGALNAGNNATFTIASISSDGTSITVKEAVVAEVDALNDDTAVVTQADGTVQSLYYYNGDTFARTHRAAENREFTIDLNAADPAFEKAIRAMSIIAQGKFGTAGGLDQNASRLTDSKNLIELSLKPNSTSNPQYEADYTSNLEQAFVTLGYQQALIQDANLTHTRLSAFFEQRVSELENINSLDAITRLLDDQKSLEASYQAMASIRSLSLHNYLR